MQSIQTRMLAATLMLAMAYPALPQSAELTLAVLEGNGARNDIREKVSKAAAVEVRHNGRPVRGARVRFTLPEFGPGGRFADGATDYAAYTNDEGVVYMAPYRPNAIEGRFTMVVDASYGGQAVSAAVAQSNVMMDTRLVDRNGEPRQKAAGTRASSKLLLALGVGAAVAIGAAFASHGSSSSGSRTGAPTTVSVGGVGVGGIN